VINHSTYSPSNEIVSVGIATDNPEAAAAVTAAVETKDDAVIRETIANWSAEAIAARAQAEADAAAQAAAAAAAASGGTTTTPSGSEGTTSTGETSAQ
jgi:hypothetical protein